MSIIQAETPAITDLAGRLRLSVTRLTRFLRQQDSGGLSLSLTSLLATIGREGSPTLGELAIHEQITPSTITGLVGKLEARALVARAADPHDGRVWRVRLTPSGRRHVDDVRHRRTAWLMARLADLAPEDLAVLARASDILAEMTSVSSEPRR